MSNKTTATTIAITKKNPKVRFPPEPNGYLHIGHLRSLYYNKLYADRNNGTLLLRFDDANPDNCKYEYVNAIIDDMKSMHFDMDSIPTSTMSQYFDICIGHIEKLLSKDLAYVETLDQETIQKLKTQKTNSESRSNTTVRNIELWNSMKLGNSSGCVVRLKIDMNSGDGTMRDPIVYKVVANANHYKTGDKYKVYPLFDFISPLVDHFDGITHIFRTNEFQGKEKLHKWILNAFGYPIPKYKTFGRFNFEYTTLSKRNIRKIIDMNEKFNWSHPVIPTVRGVLNRGIHPKALENYFSKYGVSKAGAIVAWDNLFKLNRNYLDRNVNKLFCVNPNNSYKVQILCGLTVRPVIGDSNKDCMIGKEGDMVWNPKNKELGSRKVTFPSIVLIDKKDYELFKEGDKVFLIHYGPFIFNEGSLKFDTTFESIKDYPHKVSWVDANPLHHKTVVCEEYEHILNVREITGSHQFEECVNKNPIKSYKLIIDNVDIKDGETYQFMRNGYYKRYGDIYVYVREPPGTAQYLKY